MSTTSIPRQRHTLDEYFEIERRSELKHEFYDGEVFAMSGATPAHSLIAFNVGAELRAALRGGNCLAYSNDLRIAAPSGLYTYADASVVCGPLESEVVKGLVTAKNPILIIEILSKSTEAYDRGRKMAHYLSISSLRGYLLLSSIQPMAHHIGRSPGGELKLTTADGLEGRLRLPELDVELLMSELYLNVEFPPPDNPVFAPIELHPEPHPRGPKL